MDSPCICGYYEVVKGLKHCDLCLKCLYCGKGRQKYDEWWRVEPYISKVHPIPQHHLECIPCKKCGRNFTRSGLPLYDDRVCLGCAGPRPSPEKWFKWKHMDSIDPTTLLHNK